MSSIIVPPRDNLTRRPPPIRGSKAVSRLASYYPDRFVAYAFLAVPYIPPRGPMGSFEDFLKLMRTLTGSDLFGYWLFFSEDDVDQVIRTHVRDAADVSCALLIECCHRLTRSQACCSRKIQRFGRRG